MAAALKLDQVLMGDHAIGVLNSLPLEQGRRYRITVQEHNLRTVAQNKKMWAMLTDVSKQVVWHGQLLVPEDWKDIFSAALSGQSCVPGIDGRLVVLGQRTSKKEKSWHSDLAECM